MQEAVREGDAPSSPQPRKTIIEAFLEHYQIPRIIAEKYCLTAQTEEFPEARKELEAIGFSYGSFSEPDAVKWRSLQGGLEKVEGWPKKLYGIEQLPDKLDTLVITQSELDTLSFAAAGIPAVSLPLKITRIEQGRLHTSEDVKLTALGNCREVFDKAKKIVLATHASAAGEALAEEIARRIGRAKCWRAQLPEDAPTPSRTHRKHGSEALKSAVGEAKPLPLEGVYTADDYASDVLSLYEEGMPEGLFCGIPDTEDLYRVCPGQLTIVTGTPSAGKSAGVDQMMMHLAKEHGWKFAVCSMENPPKLHISKLAAVHADRPFFKGPTPRMSGEERKEALSFINEHFCFLASMSGEGTTIESIIERTKQSILRMGVRGLVIDPFNYIDIEGDTDSIRKMLRELCGFAKAHELHVWLVAHPAKMYRQDDGSMRVPGGYDISGCYSDDTEVLTREGWKLHQDMKLDDEVACFDLETEDLVWSQPSKIHEYDYEGPMHHWTTYGLDCLVTPNHRMVVKPYWRGWIPLKPGQSPVRWHSEDWQFCRSEELPGSRFALPMTTNGEDGSPTGIPESLDNGYDLQAFWWFVGFWVAEGHVSMGSVSVCQADENSNYPRYNLWKLGTPANETVRQNRPNEKPLWTARLYARKSPEIVKWIPKHCGSGAFNKKVPSALFRGSRAEREAFMDGFFFGDGCSRRNQMLLTTISPQLAKDLQALWISLGYWANVRHENKRKNEPAHHRERYTVMLESRTQRTVQTGKNREIVQYKGKVYCLTVPTGAYISRRNGRMIICGNSANFFNAADAGLTFHRTKEGSEFHVWKARFMWTGKLGKAELGFDPPTGTFQRRVTRDRWSGP